MATRYDPIRLRDDLVYFARAVWSEMGWDRYAPIGWVEVDMLQWVQYGPTKQGVLAARGHGKTHLITVVVTLWDLYRNRSWKICVISKSQPEARKTVKLIRDCLDVCVFLQHLVPGEGCRDTVDHFDVAGCPKSKDPSVVARGITGQITGSRAHRFIGDDLETKDNSLTYEARQALLDKVREADAVASFGARRENYVGTYHHEESLYTALAKEGIAFRTWPILYPTANEKVANMSPALQMKLESGEVKPGDIVADYRYDRDYIIEKQARGLTHFAMQYMLIADLGDPERYRLRLQDLIVFACDRDMAPDSIIWGRDRQHGESTRCQDIPSQGFGTDGFYAPVMFSSDWSPYTVSKMWVDPSGHGADKFGYACVGQSHAHLWAKAIGGLDGGHTHENLRTIARIARRCGVTEIHVEDYALQSAVKELLEPVVQKHFIEPGRTDEQGILYPKGWKCSVVLTRPPGGAVQKEIRILGALEPVVSTHRLVIDPSVARNEEFQRQFTRLTTQRNCLGHEDELESLANCCALFIDDLRIDPEQSRQIAIDERMKTAINEHRKLCGLTPTFNSWMESQKHQNI